MIDEVFAAVTSNPKVYELLKTAPLKTFEKMSIHHYDTGTFQLNQNERYDVMYILVEGRVKVFLSGYSGKSVVLDVYGPGMFLGEQEAIIDQPYSASIVNITPVTLLRLPNTEFREWTSRDHRFANNLINNLSMQIYHLTKRVERYSLHSALQQVGLALLQAVDHHQLITREYLTYEVDTSYRNINRVLKQLTELEIIRIDNSVIKVLDVERLHQIIKSEG